MSSMFKKKGGLAFKPRIPLARPRPSPAPPATAVSTPKSNISQDTSEEVVEPTQASAAETPTSTVASTEEADQAPPTPPEGSDVVPSSASAPPDNACDPTSADSVETSIPPPSPQATPTEQNRATEETPIPSDHATPANEPTTSVEAQSTPTPISTQPQADLPTAIAEAPVPAESSEHPREPSVAAEQPELANSEPTALATTHSVTSAEPTQPPKPTTAKPRARKSKTTNGTAGDGTASTPKPTRKRQRKPVADGEAAAQPKPRKRNTQSANGTEPAAKKRRARSATPEDAENQVVDLQQLKMSDLTKDLHIGKKFSRHDELRDRERRARSKSKVDKDLDKSPEATESPARQGDAPNGDSSAATATPTPAPTAGPQFRIVDGQIVVDQSSLVMDRHARAAAAQAGQDMETIEENDFTRLITSSSFMNTSKLRGPNIWTDEETELFYHGLRMFGTDFEMIARMFRGKQRRNVKLKYNREERHCPERIDAVFNGEKTTPINLDEYQTLTGTQFEPVETIEAENRKVQERYEAEQKRIADEQAEISRKKREELFADDEGTGEPGGGRKRGKRRGKQVVEYGLNGEPVATTS
ncbi:hypothetical protein S40288_07313 [Stachybotrys chartarum IBT 40288]|nr:hypothetical protein S40288_07313 [Stachybotrys chartarum IBT 40288]